jgi:hypothetical protein
MLATDRLWKYSPHYLWRTESTFAIFVELTMRRLSCGVGGIRIGNAKETETWPGSRKRGSVVRLSLPPRLQKWKILINESLHFSLYFPIFSNRCFIFYFFRSETGDWRRFSASAHLASWPTEKCITMLKLFGKKIWPHKRKIVGNQSLDYKRKDYDAHSGNFSI